VRPSTDAGGPAARQPGDVFGNASQHMSFLLVTTGAGLTMFFAGAKKRRLQWRTAPRERRNRRRGGRRV